MATQSNNGVGGGTSGGIPSDPCALVETLKEWDHEVMELKASIAMVCEGIMELWAQRTTLTEKVRSLSPKASSLYQSAI